MKDVSWVPPEALTLYGEVMNALGREINSVGNNKSPVFMKMIQDNLDSKYYNCSICTRLMSANLFCKLHERKVGKKDICKSFEPIHGGFGAKKVSRRSTEGKRGSALKANQRCGKCIFFQNNYCHAHKKAATMSGTSCEEFEYIYERSDELLNKKD